MEADPPVPGRDSDSALAANGENNTNAAALASDDGSGADAAASEAPAAVVAPAEDNTNVAALASDDGSGADAAASEAEREAEEKEKSTMDTEDQSMKHITHIERECIVLGISMDEFDAFKASGEYEELKGLGITTKAEYDEFTSSDDYADLLSLAIETKAEFDIFKASGDLDICKGLGIETKQEFDEYKSSKDFKDLRALGIGTRTEYEEFKGSEEYTDLKALGIATKAEYDDFHASDDYADLKSLAIATKAAFDAFKASGKHTICKELGIVTKQEFDDFYESDDFNDLKGLGIATKALFDEFKGSDEYGDLKALGIATKEGYDAFKESPDYADLRVLGIATKAIYDEFKGTAAYEELKGLGFASKASYDEFNQLGKEVKTNVWTRAMYEEYQMMEFTDVISYGKCWTMGFKDKDAFEECELMGISTKKEFDAFRSADRARCKEMGFYLKREYEECQELGFDSKADYDECKALGFEEKDPYDACKERGFKTKDEYFDFVSWRETRGLDKIAALLDAALIGEVDIHAVETKDSRGKGTAGFSVIHFAAAFNAPPAMAQALADKNADVNAWVKSKRNRFSALHLGLRRRCAPKVVAVLLANGADAGAFTEEAKTPLHYALSEKGGPEAIYYLLAAGADPRGSLQVAVESKASPEVLGLLLAAGAENEKLFRPGDSQTSNILLTRELETGALGAIQEALGKNAVQLLLRSTEDFLKIIDPLDVQKETLDSYIVALAAEDADEGSRRLDQLESQPSRSMIPLVVVEGLTGDYATKVNGVYRPTGNVYNGKELLAQTYDSNIFMRYVTGNNGSNTWCVSSRSDKEANNADGYCSCDATDLDVPVGPHSETGQALGWHVGGPNNEESLIKYENGAIREDEAARIRSKKMFDSPPLIDAVKIEKCDKGPYTKVINGLYRPTGLNHNGKMLFRKVPVSDGDPHIWLYFESREKCNDWRVTELLGDTKSERCACKEKGLESPAHAKKWLCSAKSNGKLEEANAEMVCKYEAPEDPRLFPVQIDLKELSKKPQSLTEEMLRAKISEKIDLQLQEGALIVENVKQWMDAYSAGVRPTFYLAGASEFSCRPFNPQRSMPHIIESLKALLGKKVVQPFLIFERPALAYVPAPAGGACPNRETRFEEAKALRDVVAAVQRRDRAFLEEAIPRAQALTSRPEASYLARLMDFLEDTAIPLLHLITFEDAEATLAAAVKARDQERLESAVAIDLSTFSWAKKSPYEDAYQKLIEDSAVDLLHLVSFENARAPVDSATEKRDHDTLEQAIRDRADLSESPYETEFGKLIEDATALMYLVAFENARAILDAAIEKRDKDALEHAVENAELDENNPHWEEFRKLVEDGAKFLIAKLEYEAALVPLQAAMAKRDQRALEKAIVNAADLTGSPFDEAFRTFIEDTATALLELVTLENELRDRPNEVRLYVVHREVFLKMSEPEERLVVFQDLRKREELKLLMVDRKAALAGVLRGKGEGSFTVLAISYPWQGFGDPDSTGERAAAVAKFLREHPEIEYVWWDYLCVPQNTNMPDWEGNPPKNPYPTTYKKNDFEKLYFQTMINRGAVNLVYLGAFVLTVANALYLHRFWTQFEYMLSTRAVTKKGFRASYSRSFVTCIQSLADSTVEQEEALRAKWLKLTTADAVKILSMNDVTVTNPSDKRTLLAKLPLLEQEMIAIIMSMPQEMLDQMVADMALEEEQFDADDTVNALQAQLVEDAAMISALQKQAAEAEESAATLEEELRALTKASKGTRPPPAGSGSSKIHPM